ncbi:M48 family metallopeptidase [Halopseudomonas nanhaiensis]|uniref:M48 family metallopeptidase n=1 Tax=Halopseudomonas nanhaiensis TaxID=2830842 RepID=UPI001CC01960|nr:M48 family metallopeptidase [Halopseudomonas nanhaiensis]UAW99210.1 M48 family metallopeptidase [Halopseudomonas nanhaiensis]
MRNRFLLCLAVTGLVGCESVQTTQGGAVGVDRNQYMFSSLSSSQVDAMAAESYEKILAEAKAQKVLNTKPALVKRVRKIANDLIPTVEAFRPDARDWNWEVNIITDDQLNASCMPGGKILFFTGIIERLELTDAEIAQIMGHEIAHALREHGREAISRAYTTQMGTQVVGALFGLGQASMQAADMAVQYGLMLPNSRSNESEADLIGLELAARAGYDPNAAVSLWQKMAAASQGNPPAFLSTHPSPGGRIENLKQAIPRVQPLYEAAR